MDGENDTMWMDGILEGKTDEWIDGYIFAKQNSLTPVFYFEEYDYVWTEEEGKVFLFREDFEGEE